MRVAILIDTLQVGGAQKLVTRFASAVPKESIQPTVISFRDNPAPANLDVLHSAGVEVITFPSRSLLDAGRLRQLIRFLRTEKFDLIHTHLSYANILGCLAGFYAGIPVIATLHSTSHDSRRTSYFVMRLERVILRYFARRIVAVGNTVADAHQNHLGSRNVIVIHNGVPVPPPVLAQPREDLRRAIAGDGERPVIISIGRFVEAKGYENMIDAFAILHRQDPRPVLVIAGSGRLLDPIKRKISEMELADSVHCLGERSDIFQLLAASDIYLSSSHWEGLPVALLEAMMAGLPIVATSVGDIPHVVTPEIGILVPPRRPDCLAEALGDLISAPEKMSAMGKAARLRAMQEYSLESWMEKLTSLYEDTLRQSSMRA